MNREVELVLSGLHDAEGASDKRCSGDRTDSTIF